MEKSNPKTEKADFELDKDLKVEVLWYYQHKKREGEIPIINDEEDEKPNEEELVDILFTTEHKGRLILHWGVYKAQVQSGWVHPPKESYPPNTKEFDKCALQTEFAKENESDTQQKIHMLLPRGIGYQNALGGLNFVFFDPTTNKWYNNYVKF